jgi:hypothetical protein
VKCPEESKGPWDYFKLVSTIPEDRAFRPLKEGGCALVKRPATWSDAAKTATGTSGVREMPAGVGGPSRTRTLDPLIKRSLRDQTEPYQEDLNPHESDDPQLSLFSVDRPGLA